MIGGGTNLGRDIPANSEERWEANREEGVATR